MRLRVLVPLLLLTIPIGAALAEQTATPPADAGALRCPLSAPYYLTNAFARIIRGDLPVSVIARNAQAMAFIPLEWDHPGHALVIPTRAARNLYDLQDDELVAIMQMVKHVAVAQQRALGSSGFSLQQNNGRSQDVCHVHFHVIPNTPVSANPRATRAEMDVMAARLRAVLPAAQ